MVSDKTDFQFVSQNALANISISGTPYPVREQKLVLMGEDIADLEEGIRERNFFVDHIGLHIESSYKLANSLVYLEQYNERIREVCKDVRPYHDRISAMLATGTWMDKGKESGIPSSNPKVRCKGPSDSSDYRTKKAHIEDDIIPQFNSDVSDLNTEHADALAQLSNAYSTAVTAEEARFSSDPDISAAEAKYDRDTESAESTHSAEIEQEEELWISNKAEIERQYEDEEIDGDEYRLLLDTEDDRHTQKTRLIDNNLADALEEAITGRNEAVTRATEHHHEILDALKARYDEDVKEENDGYDAEMKSLRDTLNSTIYDYVKGNPIFAEYVYEKGYCPALQDMSDAFEAAKITKSCADMFYSRNPLFYFASTPLDRLFADLERMDSKILSPTPTVYRSAYIYTYGSGSPSYVDSSEASENGNSIVVEDDDYSGTFSNTDFYILFGARYELELIEAIYADVIIKRTDTHRREDERDEIRDGARQTVADTMNATGASWDIEYYMQNGVYHERVTVNTSGFSPERAEEIQATADSCTDILEDALRRAALIYDEQNITYSIVRTRFAFAEVVNADELAQVDSISDSFAEAKAALANTRDEAYAAAEEDYQDAVAEAKRIYAETMRQAAAARDEAIAAAKLACVETLYALAPGVNTRIMATDSAAEKARILSQFSSQVTYQKRIRDQAISDANSTYDSTDRTASRDMTRAERAARSSRTSAQNTANSQYNTSVSNLRTNYNTNYLKPINDAYKARKTAINSAYNAAVNTASNTASATIDAVVQEAENTMTSLFGPADPHSWDGWWLDHATVNGYTIYTGTLAPSNMREKANEINTNIWHVQYEAWQTYYAAVAAAKQTRWNSLNGIYPLNPLQRGRFVASISPADSPQYDTRNYVDVVGFKNFEVRYNPRMKTNVDFSDYYEELEPEEEQEEEQEAAPQG